ncbi:cation-translocating P-type ATPase [Tepidicaulis sp. LMO-SS28]|uniref:cation-translocating P-type ATPase n=1 Tax=Tepidicaulis sp. LMO-SS28 TaxID=3447455 RepID=UPI003EE41E40
MTAAAREEVLLASRALGSGARQVTFSVPDMKCGGCMTRIEKALSALDGVEEARVNLTLKRVTVRWQGETPPLLEAVRGLGFAAHLGEAQEEKKDETFSRLVRALAVAGFAAANIMGLSVSVWSGAGEEARNLFHWISAGIALPALAYAGRIFFASAWEALRHGRTNMDVPISIGVLMAFGLSLYDTATGGPHAYFDASIMLLFFLLIGRTLDHVMRERARGAVKGLARLAARGAYVLEQDGTKRYAPLEDIKPSMTLLVPAGERVPVDGTVLSGASDLDCSLVTGESAPRRAEEGSALQAGTLNLTGPLTMRAEAGAEDSFLARMMQLMEAAEGGRARYRRIADRVSRAYAPVVHLAAAFTFAGWMLAKGDVHEAVTYAVAVLIITCPCALGLAVPMVQVMAARRLFDQGIMVKDGAALEKLTEVDHAVFDKTGTLTCGTPRLRDPAGYDPAHLACAAALGAQSAHPFSRALAELGGGNAPAFKNLREIPGCGMEAEAGGATYRLGRPGWASAESLAGLEAETSCVTLSKNGARLATFFFDDPLRPGAQSAVAALTEQNIGIEVLSGDRQGAVAALARRLGLSAFTAGMMPDEKIARVERVSAAGHKVLMVGDGLNDAPALSAAHVSMAPASAADIGRNAADFVFLHGNLEAVPQALQVSRKAARLVRQNFAIALLYNAVAMPLAVFGLVTPLIAALAMSLSSIIVVANALRLTAAKPRRSPLGPEAPLPAPRLLAGAAE